ncbi:ATPase [Candidatus Micrarchaeota archaeon]|nr:ATPase [Candidatus Micrarchaeota archaeon]
MAQRSIREFDGKKILAVALGTPLKGALVSSQTDWTLLVKENPWLKTEKLVAKPDMCFGKRGKNNLLLLDATLEQAKSFCKEKIGKSATVGKVSGTVTHVLIEPFVPHKTEYYVAFKCEQAVDVILFSPEGGIDIEENWEKVQHIEVPVLEETPKLKLNGIKDASEKKTVEEFILNVFQVFRENDFSFLELNPFTLVKGEAVILGSVARLDDTAGFKAKWDVEFPAPFGRELSKEEQYIKSLDEKTGASLKLTVLNPKGKVWTLVAGGGASVIYADTLVDLGFGKEMANYGEYSGNPNDEETYQYAKTVLDLMVKGGGKVLLIGGGIANFTDVAKTFKGIIQALEEQAPALKKAGVKIYVRRGGPNYEKGLDLMRQLGVKTGIPIQVFGPETHMTKIVPMALKELKS